MKESGLPSGGLSMETCQSWVHGKCQLLIMNLTVPIVVSALLWSHKWVGKRILIHVDNAAVCAIIFKGRSRSTLFMNLMRILTWLAFTNNFIVHAVHVPTKKNIVDSLSRLKYQAFRRLVPSADPSPTKVPPMEAWVLE